MAHHQNMRSLTPHGHRTGTARKRHTVTRSAPSVTRVCTRSSANSTPITLPYWPLTRENPKRVTPSLRLFFATFETGNHLTIRKQAHSKPTHTHPTAKNLPSSHTKTSHCVTVKQSYISPAPSNPVPQHHLHPSTPNAKKTPALQREGPQYLYQK